MRFVADTAGGMSGAEQYVNNVAQNFMKEHEVKFTVIAAISFYGRP